MSIDNNSTSPAETAGYRGIGLPAEWSERLITVVAISIAVVIVAVVAVLMGMA